METMISIKKSPSVYGDREALGLLGERLRAVRLQKNQTQEELARFAGISRPTYRKIEAGDGSVETGVFARVLAMLGFANRLGDVIPEMPPPVDFRAVMKPARLRARGNRGRKS